MSAWTAKERRIIRECGVDLVRASDLSDVAALLRLEAVQADIAHVIERLRNAAASDWRAELDWPGGAHELVIGELTSVRREGGVVVAEGVRRVPDDVWAAATGGDA